MGATLIDLFTTVAQGIEQCLAQGKNVVNKYLPSERTP